MFDVFPKYNYYVVEIKEKDANLEKADEAKRLLLKLIDEDKRYLIVDFKNVEYVDSSFLAALVSGFKYTMLKHGDIGLINLNKDISYLFEMIRLDKIFRIFSSFPESFDENYRGKDNDMSYL